MKTKIRRRPHIGQHVLLLILAVFWLIPIVWLVLNSFSVSNGPDLSHFFPTGYTLNQYKNLLSSPDAANQFPTWFKNTFIIAIFNCVISTMFVLMVAYAMSRMRFKGRKALMNFGMILGLFPGALTMVAIYATALVIGYFYSMAHFGEMPLTSSNKFIMWAIPCAMGWGYNCICVWTNQSFFGLTIAIVVFAIMGYYINKKNKAIIAILKEKDSKLAQDGLR